MDTYMELIAEIKALRAEVEELRAKPKMTKEEILSVKDRSKRLALISENMDLFVGDNR